MTEHNRRSSDQHRLPIDIETMILQEDDPKQRAFLIVLNSINNSLVANTQTIRDVSERLDSHLTNFEQHAKEEEALLNKGRGMWKIAGGVIALAQLVGLGIWQNARIEIGDIHKSITDVQLNVSQLESRVLYVEKVAK